MEAEVLGIKLGLPVVAFANKALHCSIATHLFGRDTEAAIALLALATEPAHMLELQTFIVALIEV